MPNIMVLNYVIFHLSKIKLVFSLFKFLTAFADVVILALQNRI